MKSIFNKYTLVFVAAILISFLTANATNNDCLSTNCATLKYNNAIAVNYTFEDEGYINDIPFNTDKISMEHNYNNAISTEFSMEDESFVDDIPFNTRKVVRKHNLK